MKIVLIFLAIYVVGLFFSFLSEITYRKRTISEVKKDYRRIWRNATIIYCIFVVATSIYYFLGIKTE